MPVRWLGKLPGDELHGLVGYQLRWIDGPDEFVMDSRMHEFDDQAVLTQMSFVVHTQTWSINRYEGGWVKPPEFAFEVPAAMSPLEEE